MDACLTLAAGLPRTLEDDDESHTFSREEFLHLLLASLIPIALQLATDASAEVRAAFARRAGAPFLLLALAIGMLLGEDGPGQIQFSNFSLAFELGSVALAVILFAGGLEAERSVFRTAGRAAASLATFGVLITAAVTGSAAVFILNIGWMEGLLLGAAVASTDAAATFLLVQQSGIDLRKRVRDTLMLESGINDPMAIFLTISLTTMVAAQHTGGMADYAGFAIFLAQQAGIGLIAGLAGGRALAFITDRLNLPMGTYPALTLTGALGLSDFHYPE